MSGEKVDGVPLWYAIHTNPRQEDRADINLRAWGVETFSPKLKEHRVNQFTGVPIYVTVPLFPTYIFARFKVENLLNKVKFTRGIQSVVCCNGIPSPIEDEIITYIQSRVGRDGFVRIGGEFGPGDKVMIKSGPFKNFIGIFEQEMKGAERVMILLASISYQGRVLVRREQLEKVC